MSSENSDSQERRTRRPYHSPTFRRAGKLQEADFELLAVLAHLPIVISHPSSQNKKAILDRFVRLGFADSKTITEDETRYQISEFGEQVLAARKKMDADESE